MTMLKSVGQINNSKHEIGQKYPAGCRSALPRRIGVPNNILNVLYPLDVFYPLLSCVYSYFSLFLTLDV